MSGLRSAGALAVAALAAPPAAAQGWEFDARRIALGGGDAANIAFDLDEVRQPSRSIVIPIGLVQVLSDLAIYDPDSSQFDPVRAAQNLSTPFHVLVDRDSLNTTGPSLDGGLAVARGWGHQFVVAATDRSSHGVYVGAGPYLSVTTTAVQPTGSTTQSQIAAAIAGGYRGRFALAPGSSQDAVFVAINYNYLVGFRYDEERFGSAAAPILHRASTSGSGAAVDVGVVAALGRLTLGSQGDNLT